MIFTKIIFKGTIVDLKDNNKGFVAEDTDGEILFFIDSNFSLQLNKGEIVEVIIEDVTELHSDSIDTYYGKVEHYQPNGFYYSSEKTKNIIQRLLTTEAKGLITYTGKDLADYFEEEETFKITIRLSS